MAQPAQTPLIPCIKEKIENINWKVHIYGSIGLYELKINKDTTLPTLFGIPNIDNIEMEDMMKVIIGLLPILEKKYHKICIIKFCYINNMMKESMDKASIGRDDIKTDDITIINKDLIDYYEKCAMLTHYIIINRKLRNVEVLSKDKGCCIAVNLVSKSTNYSKLNLMSPDSLCLLKLNHIKNIKMHVGWNCNMKSMHDKDMYDMAIKKLNITQYISKMYEYWGDMINDIISLSY